MKNFFFAFLLLLGFSLNANAQATVAMDFSGNDCNGNYHHLFSDLNAGKAVVLFYYMPNCGTCPPRAAAIQTMVNNILGQYPGMVTGYAYPYQNSTTCTYSASWVTNNNLTFYAPMDSGATQVAYYGGFGMPTVVLLGGTDHRVMFSTLTFSYSDTTLMHDSIVALLGPAGINDPAPAVKSVKAYPNPSNDMLQVEVDMLAAGKLKLEVVNLLGETVAEVYEGQNGTGIFRREISTAGLSNGMYYLRVISEGRSENYSFSVSH